MKQETKIISLRYYGEREATIEVMWWHDVKERWVTMRGIVEESEY